MKQISKDALMENTHDYGGRFCSPSVNNNLVVALQHIIHDLVLEAVPELVSQAVPLVISQVSAQTVPDRSQTESKYIYGLEGIKKEFGVGYNTAQRLKDGVLRDAVLQAGPGCKILVDRKLARKLFAEYIKKEEKL